MKLVYVSILSIIVLSVTVLFFSGDQIFSGDIVELAIATNGGVSCKSWTGIVESDVAGNKISYSPITVNFPVSTQFNILSTRTGNTLSLLDPSAFVECKSLSSSFTDFNLVGGTVRTTFYGLQENGQWITLKTVDRNISTLSKPILNQKQIIPTGAITGTEINSKLTSSKEFFTTQVKITVNANYVFKGKSTGTLVNSGTAIMSNIIYVKLYNPIISPTPSTSTVVRLTSLSGSSFDLKNYQSSTISLTVTGELPSWKDTEGVPYVEIIDPTRHVLGKFPMNVKRLVSSSTNTWEFKSVNINIPKSPQGTWNVYMHSNGDVRKISSNLPSADVKTFNIYNSLPVSSPSPIPVPTTQCLKLTSGQEICLVDDEFKSGGICYNFTLSQCVIILNQAISTQHVVPKAELGTATAFVAYVLTFDQGGKDVGIFPKDGTVNVDLISLSLVASPKGIDEKLQTIRITQAINTSTLGASTISNLNVNTNFNILVDGVDTGIVQLSPNQIKRVGAYSTTKDSYLMNDITLNSVDVMKFLTDIGYRQSCGVVNSFVDNCIELVDGQTITIQSITDGTFNVQDASGTHQASFTGLTFTYDLRYISDSSFNPEPCQGLSGEELLSCRGSDPNNCVDFIAIQGDENCNTKEQQTGGSCAGLTSTECAKQGKTGGNLGGITENPLCDVFGIGCNPTGKGSDVTDCKSDETSQQCIDRIKRLNTNCPNGSFETKDTSGKTVCLDNTTRDPVNPLLGSFGDIISGIDTQSIIIIILVILFVALLVILAKRRKR